MDPFSHFPEELSTQIFSFTNTPTIRRCTRLSRSIKSRIESSQSIHRKVDLLELNQSNDLPLIIQEIFRSSQLAAGRIQDIKIDMSFLHSAPAAPAEWLKSLFGGFRVAERSVESLTFRFPTTVKNNISNVSLIVSIFHELREVKSAFLKINHLSFFIPESLDEVECSSPDGTIKVTVKSIGNPFYYKIDDKGLIKLLDQMKKFCGGKSAGLNTFLVEEQSSNRPRRLIHDFDEKSLITGDHQAILKEVESSKATLKELNLGGMFWKNVEESFDLIASCPQLEMLTIVYREELFGYEKAGMGDRTDFSKVSNLKHLMLNLDGISFKLNPKFVTWLGSSLETLVVAHPDLFESQGPISISEISHILSPLSASLKNLELTSIREDMSITSWSIDEKHFQKGEKSWHFAESDLEFPHLEILRLNRCQPSIITIFKPESLCKLKEFVMDNTFWNPAVPRRKYFDEVDDPKVDHSIPLLPVLEIIKASRNTLEKLNITKMRFKLAKKG